MQANFQIQRSHNLEHGYSQDRELCRNKCLTSSNKCLTGSNKKLLITILIKFFLLLLVRHLFLVVRHLLLVAMHLFLLASYPPLTLRTENSAHQILHTPDSQTRLKCGAHIKPSSLCKCIYAQETKPKCLL